MIAFIHLFPCLSCVAQEHLLPPNGADGRPGPFDRSFEIHWGLVDNAIAYEYVLSDNPLCFSGCPGDTRQQIVEDTFAVEYNLQVDVWYSWITRVIKSDGDTTNWSNISSFLAKEQKTRGSRFFQFGPNPTKDQELKITINWENNPVARHVDIQLLTLTGITFFSSRLSKEGYYKFNQYEVNLKSAAPGLLLLIGIIDGNPNNPNNRFIEKVILQ